jgi:lipoic acid synthetase
MILGDICTRNCGFCGVQKGRPSLPDPDEPKNIALAARALGLKHVVITSVTRDDLPRGGAEAFALTIRELKVSITGVVVEALTPDFGGDGSSLDMVFRERPDVFNHNVETVPSLYPSVRPQADYIRSLKVLERAKKSALFTKSGIMAGLGEKKEEVEALLRDLKDAGCDALTIGQYLSPSRENLPVKEFVSVERFEEYRQYGMNIGIKHIWAGAFVRSSYNAEGFFAGSE